ncbi:hypothetical protein TNCV_674961 [Trichonephila clavipes]|nr:hypothetical protein TNCV_674961 [Trichonephila clavipes]
MIYSQFGLAIHQNDHQAIRFVEWAQNEIAVPDFRKRILFSDEALLVEWLRQQTKLPHLVNLIHKFNGGRYRAMITKAPELNNHDVQELWFQQDGATCHTARATIDLLKDTFGDRLISRFGPVKLATTCDLTP